MDFLTLAKARYSVRKLSDHPIEKEKIERAEFEALFGENA